MLMHAEGVDKPEFLERHYKCVIRGPHTILTDVRDPYTSQNLELLRLKLEEKYKDLTPDLAIAGLCIGETGEDDDKNVLTYEVSLYTNKHRSR